MTGRPSGVIQQIKMNPHAKEGMFTAEKRIRGLIDLLRNGGYSQVYGNVRKWVSKKSVADPNAGEYGYCALGLTIKYVADNRKVEGECDPDGDRIDSYQWLMAGAVHYFKYLSLYGVPCELVRRYYEANDPEMYKLHYPQTHTQKSFTLVRMNDGLLLSLDQIGDILELYWFGDEPESIRLLREPLEDPRNFRKGTFEPHKISDVTFSQALAGLR